MPSYRSLVFVVALVVVTLPLFGCGQDIDPRRASVSGSITLDGEPVPNGSISFYPAPGSKGGTAGGDVIDGVYTISRAKGPMVGKYIVKIRSPYATGRKIMAGRQQIDEHLDRIPTKYNRYSKQEVDVQAGKNTLDFPLQTQ